MRGSIDIIPQLKVNMQDGSIMKDGENTGAPLMTSPTNTGMTVEAFRGDGHRGAPNGLDEVIDMILWGITRSKIVGRMPYVVRWKVRLKVVCQGRA